MLNCTIFWYECCSDVTIVQYHVTIVVPWQLSTRSKHNYLFCYCPLVGILFEILRILSTSNRIPTRRQEEIWWPCLLPVDSCHGTTIVTSDCTIVTSEQHLYQPIVQFDKTLVLPRKHATGSIVVVVIYWQIIYNKCENKIKHKLENCLGEDTTVEYIYLSTF